MVKSSVKHSLKYITNIVPEVVRFYSELCPGRSRSIEVTNVSRAIGKMFKQPTYYSLLLAFGLDR